MGQTPAVLLRHRIIPPGIPEDVIANADQIGHGTAQAEQVPGHYRRRPIMHLGVKHFIGQQRGHTVQKHTSLGVQPVQRARKVPPPLHRLKSPARPVCQVAPDAGPILFIRGFHGGPIVQGISFGQVPGQALCQSAFAAFAAA